MPTYWEIDETRYDPILLENSAFLGKRFDEAFIRLHSLCKEYPKYNKHPLGTTSGKEHFNRMQDSTRNVMMFEGSISKAW